MLAWKARSIAEGIRAGISPYCKRVEIVGSIRRGEKEVKDIDMLALVEVKKRKLQGSMFGVPSAFDEVDPLRRHLEGCVVFLSEGGHVEGFSIEEATVTIESVGPKQIKLKVWTNRNEVMKVDLWTVYDVERWGGAMAIRTGPWQFSKALVTHALYRHTHVVEYLVHTHEKTGRPGARGECNRDLECKLIADTDTEEKFFHALGLPYMAPELRHHKHLMRASQKMMAGRNGSD